MIAIVLALVGCNRGGAAVTDAAPGLSSPPLAATAPPGASVPDAPPDAPGDAPADVEQEAAARRVMDEDLHKCCLVLDPYNPENPDPRRTAIGGICRRMWGEKKTLAEAEPVLEEKIRGLKLPPQCSAKRARARPCNRTWTPSPPAAGWLSTTA